MTFVQKTPINQEGVKIENEKKQDMPLKYAHKEKKPYQCHTCDESFSYKVTLKRHVEVVHEQNKQYKCSICNDSFFKKLDLEKHLESVHEKIKPHKCSICNKGFDRRRDRVKHEFVYEKKMNQKCHVCI